MKYANRLKNFTIFLMFIVILIDIMSYSIVFPIMPGLFYSSAGLMPPGSSLFLRNIFYGITLAIGPLGIFIGPPILGKLSDIIGRKKVIIYCLAINIILYFISGFLIMFHMLILFIIVRFFIGLFAGNFAAAQTVILDFCDNEKEKMKNLGWISLAAYIALILGPAVSGITVEIFSD
ncbi:MAG: MFS transporter, partial [Fusobacteria bacterium]|nr:MFS transporter [Fusobacteriota bacterium]